MSDDLEPVTMDALGKIDEGGHQVPAVPEEAVVMRDSTLKALRSVLLRLDDRRAELVAEGDIDQLAAGAQDLQTLLFDLQSIERQVRTDLASMIDDGDEFGINRRTVEGVGVVEVKGGWTRKGWRSEKLLWEVIARALADAVDAGEWVVNTDGEMVAPAESITVEKIYDALVTTLPITPSLSWRTGQEKPDGTVTGLKSLGFSDADWCEREEKPRLASVPKRAI